MVPGCSPSSWDAWCCLSPWAGAHLLWCSVLGLLPLQAVQLLALLLSWLCSKPGTSKKTTFCNWEQNSSECLCSV